MFQGNLIIDEQKFFFIEKFQLINSEGMTEEYHHRSATFEEIFRQWPVWKPYNGDNQKHVSW